MVVLPWWVVIALCSDCIVLSLRLVLLVVLVWVLPRIVALLPVVAGFGGGVFVLVGWFLMCFCHVFIHV